MPSVLTIDGNRPKAHRHCKYRLTRIFHDGEREVKGCFESKKAANNFADMLNPRPCWNYPTPKHCWVPIHGRPPGVPLTTFRGGRRRRGLGSPASDHAKSAESYRNVFNDAMFRTDRWLSQNKCTSALTYLIEMAEMTQGFRAHASAFQRGRSARLKIANKMDSAISDRVTEFRNRCLIRR